MAAPSSAWGDPGLREGSGLGEMMSIPLWCSGAPGRSPQCGGETLWVQRSAGKQGFPLFPLSFEHGDMAGFDLKALPGKHEMSLLPGQP